MNKQDFRILMLHEFKLGHSAAEATRNINGAWGMESVAERTVRRWFQKFASGHLNLKDESGRGRKSSLHNEKLRATIAAHPVTKVQALGSNLGVKHPKIRRHLAQIGKGNHIGNKTELE